MTLPTNHRRQLSGNKMEEHQKLYTRYPSAEGTHRGKQWLYTRKWRRYIIPTLAEDQQSFPEWNVPRRTMGSLLWFPF